MPRRPSLGAHHVITARWAIGSAENGFGESGSRGYAGNVLPTDHVLAFALISFVLIIVPGPNVLFVISRSLMLGRPAGVGTAVGGQIGVYLQVTAVAFGIGALVERSVAVFTVIKLAGAAYLDRKSVV